MIVMGIGIVFLIYVGDHVTIQSLGSSLGLFGNKLCIYKFVLNGFSDVDTKIEI